MIAAVAGPAARTVSSMVSVPKREIEIGRGGKDGMSTIANWPNSPARKAASRLPSVSVTTSAVSGRTATTRAVTYEPGVAAAGCGFAVSGRGASGGAIASSSSRTSMPTGHHVMHRPQPTHPALPNWSTQVANLWVSHWRYRSRGRLRKLPPATRANPAVKHESQTRSDVDT